MRFISKIILSFMIIIFMSACAVKAPPVYEKNAKKYGWTGHIFSGEWYDYYECAISYIDGEFYPDALIALDEAIRRNPEDKLISRTYGMRFINLYVPHQKKGLIYYLQGNYEAATRELELSLNYLKSDKTNHYLDKVRRKIIELEAQPISAPRINFITPLVNNEQSEEIWTNKENFMISGYGEDHQYISEITINNRKVFMEGSQKRIDFYESFQLDHGRHDIEIHARNLMGGMTAHQLAVHVDRMGPQIVVQKVEQGVGIWGYVYDESGKIELFADEKQVYISEGEDVPFHIPLTSSLMPLLKAKDRVGNETVLEVTPELSSFFENNILTAQNSSDIAVDVGFREKPTIVLKSINDHQTVYADSVLIPIEVRSRHPITCLKINGISFLLHHGSIVSMTYTFFRLNEGSNSLMIEAGDASGAFNSKQITIIRKIPEPFQLKHRYSMKISPSDNTDESLIFQMALSETMGKQKRFQVFTEKDAAPVQILAAMKTYYDNTPEAIHYYARLTDTSTGELFSIYADAYTEEKNSFTANLLAGRISDKIHHEFPMTSGRIKDIDGKTIIADMENKSVKLKWHMLVYREEKQENVSETLFYKGSEATILGYGRMNQMNCSECEILTTEKLRLNIGDRIITK